MAKIFNKVNFTKLTPTDSNFIDLSEFVEVVATGGSKKGDIGITETAGSYRVVLYSPILSALNDAECVNFYIAGNKVAIKELPPDSNIGYLVKKGGIIYSGDLAEKLMALAPDVTFEERSTTRFGHIMQVQEDEDGSTIVIVSFD